MTHKSGCGDRRSKSFVELESGSDLGKIVLSDDEIHVQNADEICVKLGPTASPCRSALDVVASFTTPVDIVSMHNLFLQEVVNGMVHVHVMYVCNPYVICESRFLSAGWSLGAVILLYNDLRVGFSM